MKYIKEFWISKGKKLHLHKMQKVVLNIAQSAVVSWGRVFSKIRVIYKKTASRGKIWPIDCIQYSSIRHFSARILAKGTLNYDLC